MCGGILNADQLSRAQPIGVSTQSKVKPVPVAGRVRVTDWLLAVEVTELLVVGAMLVLRESMLGPLWQL